MNWLEERLGMGFVVLTVTLTFCPVALMMCGTWVACRWILS